MRIPREKPPASAATGSDGHHNTSGSHTVSNHDVHVKQALDAVCSSSEQTYQQLMESFTYLTPADIQKSQKAGHPCPVSAAAAAAALMTPSSACSELSSLSDTGSVDDCSQHSQEGATVTVSQTSVDADGLEEQVLSEGTKTSDILLRPNILMGAMAVKVDNFVAEGDLEETADDEEGYQASFTAEGDKHNRTETVARSCGSESNKASIAPSGEVLETTKPRGESRLINKTSWMNVEETASRCWAKYSSRDTTPKGQEQQEIWDLIADGEEEDEDEEDEGDEEGEDKQAAADVETCGCSRNESVPNLENDQHQPSPHWEDGESGKRGGLNDELQTALSDHSDEDTTVLSQKKSFSPPAVRPSETSESADSDSTPVTEGEDTTAYKVNPGEIAEEEEVCREGDVLNVRQLPFSARLQEDCDPDCSDPEADSVEKCSNDVEEHGTGTAEDAVQPFTLDENFDYDNVVLTPKYSQTEMAVLMAAALQTQDPTQRDEQLQSAEGD